MSEKINAGFKYLFEIIDANGEVRDSEVVKNIVPTQGLNYILGVALKGAAQVSSWFVGVYSGNYTPVPGDTAASFLTSATESSAYSEATRVALTLGAVTGGNANNSAAKAEFSINGNVTLYGGFVSSSAAKGSTSGTLVSAVRFSSPKTLVAGEVLRVTTGFTLASA